MIAKAPASSSADAAKPRQVGAPRVVDVVDLLGDDREVIIDHRGERYRLRLTQNGKLLLTK